MKRFFAILISLILSLNLISIPRAEEKKVEKKTDEKLEEKVEEKVEEETKVVDKKTISNLVQTALLPVGKTMYIWGGGWNEADNGSGIEAVTLGVSSRWEEFFNEQDASYNYEYTKYQIHDGLDCSGYIGWLMYNVFETENNQAGYVNNADYQIYDFASLGWGEVIPYYCIESYQCGDIMSDSGHIYLVLGSCEDGSILLAHASPPGVRICGTPARDGNVQSQAVALAEQVMSEHFEEWYEKYPDCLVQYFYLTNYNQFKWNDTLSDPDDLRNKSAQEVVEFLF